MKLHHLQDKPGLNPTYNFQHSARKQDSPQKPQNRNSKATISNRNQELLETHFMILRGFSLIFMINIICDKTITKTSAAINTTDKSLKDIVIRQD